MDTAFTVLKLIGSTSAIVVLVVMLAKAWKGAQQEKLISIYEKELELAREHIKQSDDTVKHYRDEMHAVRGECEAKVAKIRNQLDVKSEELKQSEIENAGLKAKTDLSPVMDTMAQLIEQQRTFIKEQTLINKQVLEGLTELLHDRPKSKPSP